MCFQTSVCSPGKLSQTPDNISFLFIQNVSRKVCQTARCYFLRHFEYKNVIWTYFRLPTAVMLRALRYLKTQRDAAPCQFLRTASNLNPTSAKHLSCSFRSIVLGRELSPLYRSSWGHIISTYCTICCKQIVQ